MAIRDQLVARLGSLTAPLLWERLHLPRYQQALMADLRLAWVPSRAEPLDLEQLYVPRRLSEPESTGRRGDSRAEAPPGGRVLDVWEALLRAPRLVLLGNPGVGLTTLLKYLAICFAQDQVPQGFVRRLTLQQERVIEHLVPFYVSLSDWHQSGQDLLPYLAGILTRYELPEAAYFLNRKLAAGECLLLLDGLQEILNGQAQSHLVEQISQLVNRYGSRNPIIVTCHLAEYTEPLPGFTAFELLSFDEAESEAFVRHWFAHQPMRAQALLDSLAQAPGARALTVNPLILSILVTVYERARRLPHRRIDLYTECVRILLQDFAKARHIYTLPEFDWPIQEQVLQGVAYRLQESRRRVVPRDELLAWLSALLPLANRHSDESPTFLNELISRTGLLVPRGQAAYEFLHPAFQEYLAAGEIFHRGLPLDTTRYAADPWWSGVLVILSGMQGDASTLVETLRAQAPTSEAGLFLAAQCLAEAPQTASSLREVIVTELFATFEREPPAPYQQAGEAIVALQGRPSAEIFADLLQSPEEALRVRAALAMGRLQEPWAVPLLISALADKSRAVRARAAWALGQMHDERAVRPLIQALAGTQADVHQAVSAALGALGPLAMNALLQALNDTQPQVRQGVAAALECIGTPAVEPLVRTLGDDQAVVRQTAQEALQRIGTPAVGHLMAALQNEHWEYRRTVVETLGKIADPQSAPALLRALGDQKVAVRQAAQQAVARLGPSAVPLLINALLEIQLEIRQGAAEALSQIGEPALEGLIAALRDERFLLRRRVIEVLERMADERVVQPLIQALDDVDGGVRKAAATVLGKIGGNKAVPPLVQALHDQDDHVRQAAAEALSRLGDGQATQPLLDALADHNLAVQRAAIDALGRLGQHDPQILQSLISALVDSRWEVRTGAREALRQAGELATDALLAALSDERFLVRQRAAELLGQIGDRRAVAPLIKTTSDQHAEVCRAAAEALGRLGDAQATPTLAALLQEADDEGVRERAAEALGRLADPRAVPALVQALGISAEQVRTKAAEALVAMGGVAVEPLIVAIHAAPGRVDQQLAIKVLGEIADRRQESSLWGDLAPIYHRLLSEPHTLDEILPLVSKLQWWRYGAELSLSFGTIDTFQGYQILAEVGQAQDYLPWMSGIQTWLRPAVQRIFNELATVAEYVQVYLGSTTRRNRSDALLSAHDALNEAQSLIDRELTVGPEADLFRTVIGRWRQLVNQAFREMGGQAELALTLRTDSVQLAGPGESTILVAELINSGDSVARDVTVSLRPALHGEFALGEARQTLRSLGVGETRQVQFTVLPREAGYGELTFDVRYADVNREDQLKTFGTRAQFYPQITTYRSIETNPYITGLPVKTSKMFYGRQDIFDWVRDNLSGTYQANALLLYGQRRTGKSSILYQLVLRPPVSRHIFVLFDCQLHASGLKSSGDLLYDLARETGEAVKEHDLALPIPVLAEYLSDPYRRFREFCTTLENALGGQRLVFMLDEFDLLIEAADGGSLDPHILHFIRGLMQHSRNLAFIFSGTYTMRQKQQQITSILFRTTKAHKIGLLQEAEARRLILEPVQDYLDYHALAVERLLQVTACHPCFIQFICHSLVEIAQHGQKNYIDLRDVNAALQEVLQDTEGNLRVSYEGLPAAQRKVLAALAEITSEEQPWASPPEITRLLERYNLALFGVDLSTSLLQLREQDYLQEKRDGQQWRYAFTMELLRLWLRQQGELLRLKQQEEAR